MLRPKAENGSFERQTGSWFGKQSNRAVSSHNQPTHVKRSILRSRFRAGLIALATAFLSAGMAHAQGTYTAASSNESDVNAVINGPTHTAVNGDSIQIPCSGTQSVTWTSTLTVTASITITALGGTPNSGPSTFGSGTNCLTILDNNPSGPIWYLGPTYASSNNVTTLQNMNLDPITSSTSLYGPLQINGTATSSGFPQVRINNIVFGKSAQWTESGNGNNAVKMIREDDVIGVVDHTTIPSGSAVQLSSPNFSSYLGVGQYGDNSWAQPDSFGGANNWFEENNVFYGDTAGVGGNVLNDCTEAPPSGSSGGGCRVVNRFNHVTLNAGFQMTSGHGTDTTGRPRSARHTETYGNTALCNVGECSLGPVGFRGGTGLAFGNTLTDVPGSSAWSNMFGFTVYRTVFGNSPFGYCGGLNALDPGDTNDNTVYYSGTLTASGLTMTDGTKSFPSLTPTGAPYSVYDTTQGFVAEVASNTSTTITVQPPISESTWSGFNNGDAYEVIRSTVCIDQGGRGAGAYISGGSPSPSSALNQALDPVYEWDDTVENLNGVQVITDTARIIANRDYYTDNSLGSPQAQTSPTSPFTGASGVGFGTLANRPTSCTTGVGYWATDQGSWNTSGNSFGQGQLYKCTSTNTWNLAYTPYAYPHPLVSGSSSGATPPPPLNVTGTVVQ